MHIAFLLAQLGVGGAERQFIGLASGLVARGHQVRFFTLFGAGALDEKLRSEVGVEPESLLVSRPRFASLHLPRLAPRLRRRLLDSPPSVLYSGDFAGNLVAASVAPAHGIPVVWGIRTQGSNLSPTLRFLRLAGRPLRNRVALAISNSQAGLEYHRRIGYLPQRGVVIPGGVDTEWFRPVDDDREREESRSRLGLENDRLWVGIVARFDPMKDHATFLAAALRVAERSDSISFVVIAPSVDRIPDAFDSSRALLGDRLRFLAARGDPAPVLRTLDVLVSSSVAEGFPNAVLEGMASAVPCAVTDAGDSRLAVAETGRVVGVGDAESLADAILALCALECDERRALGRRARARVVEEFAIGRMVERTEDALRSVLGAA